jgi:hypothetical protein
VPAQTVLALAAIETLAVKFGFTVIVIEFDKAGLLVAQLTFEVSKQVMASPLVGEYVYVALVAPAMLFPFFFH